MFSSYELGFFLCIFGPFFHLNFKHMNMYFAATLW